MSNFSNYKKFENVGIRSSNDTLIVMDSSNNNISLHSSDGGDDNVDTLSIKNIINKSQNEDLNLSSLNGTTINPVITINNNHGDCRITTNLNVNGNLNITKNLIIPTHSETSTLLANVQGSIYYNTSENMYEGYSQTEGWQPLGGFSKTKDAVIHKNLNVIGNINLTNNLNVEGIIGIGTNITHLSSQVTIKQGTNFGVNLNFQEREQPSGALTIAKKHTVNNGVSNINDGGGNNNCILSLISDFGTDMSSSHLGGSIQFTTQTDNSSYGHGQAYAGIYGGRARGYENYNGELIFYTSNVNPGAPGNYDTNTGIGKSLNPVMTIAGDKRVGIGTTNPTKALDINGDIKCSSITSSDLTASRALISNPNGKIVVSDVTTTELGYLEGVTSSIQEQLDSKQDSITGAATTISSSDLTASRALISNESGEVAVSNVTTTELGYLEGVTSSIKTQLDSKQEITGAATTISSSDLTASRALISNSNGKVAVSDVTTNELDNLSNISQSADGNSLVKRDANGDIFCNDLNLSGGHIRLTGSATGFRFHSNKIYFRNTSYSTDVLEINDRKVTIRGITTNTPGTDSHPLTITGYRKTTDPNIGSALYYKVANKPGTNSPMGRAIPISGDVKISRAQQYGTWVYEGGETWVSSDSRIKKNIVDVPDNLALEQLRSIPCRYYEYIDKISREGSKTIGFIAQEVKEVLPMAVTRENMIIPNVFKIIICTWTSNADKFIMSSTDLTNVNGIVYKFYVSNESDGSDEKEIILTGNSDNTFTFDAEYNTVFCYGSEVDDFNILNKVKLFTLNFSATQEIDRIQQTHTTEIASLKTENTELKTEFNELTNKIKNATTFEEFKNSL